MARRASGPAPLPAPQFAQRLAKGRVPAVVALAGAEGWFRGTAREALVAAVLPGGDPGGALTRLDAKLEGGAEVHDAALDELRSSSLFAAAKVVVVQNAEALKRKGVRSIRDTLLGIAADALQSAPPGALLILETAKPVKGKTGVPAAALLEAGAWVVDCRPLYDAPGPWERGAAAHEHELARYLTSRMRDVFRKRMDVQVSHHLTRCAGSVLAELDDALRALALYVGEAEVVSAEDVDAAVGVTREDPLWKLSDAIFDRNRPEALRLLAATFERGVTDQRGAAVVRPEALAAMLLATLHGAYRRVLAGTEAFARGASPSDIAREAGVPPFIADRFAARCQRDPAALLSRNRAFFEAEVGIKGGGAPPRLAVEKLVVSLLGD